MLIHYIPIGRKSFHKSEVTKQVCITFFVNGNICFPPFIRKCAILNARFEYHLKRFADRFTAYFDHADADHIMAMNFIIIKILNYFKSIASFRIDWRNWIFFWNVLFENEKENILEIFMMEHWSTKKELKNSAFPENWLYTYSDKKVAKYVFFVT